MPTVEDKYRMELLNSIIEKLGSVGSVIAINKYQRLQVYREQWLCGDISTNELADGVILVLVDGGI